MTSAISETVESLMEKYDSEYNQKNRNTKSAASAKVRILDEDVKDPRVELTKQMFVDKTITYKEYLENLDDSRPEFFSFKTDDATGKTRVIEYTLGDVDAKYPRHEWIQLLLDNGVKIEDFQEYQEYLDIRNRLFSKELHAAGDDDIAITIRDYTVLKAHLIKNVELKAFIDKQIRELQLIHEARRNEPDVSDWTVIGENALPSIAGRMYVCKTESGYKLMSKKTSNDEPKLSVEQKAALQDNGIEPEGWEVVYIDEKGNLL